MGFNEDFVWGVATASYQIEGAYNEDGKGLNVWDIMSTKNGVVRSGHTGNIACNHYHTFKEDIKLMASLDIKAYRFSISWARIMPDGTGKINQKGIDFYNKLINELTHYGITPYVTLFHWDYPYELYKKGGWLNPDSPKWFEEYTKVVVENFSDRVSHWMTLNEPQCFINLGHMTGMDAPCLKLPLDQILLASHNCLLAHGRAVKVIRAEAKLKPVIGYAPVCSSRLPWSNSEEDIKFANEAMFSTKEMGVWSNSWWMDPVFLGKYPDDGLEHFKNDLPKITDSDMELISQPIDFCGANIYQGSVVYKDRYDKFHYPEGKVGEPETAMEWPVTPTALYWGPKFLYERYKKPILITENGMANLDWIALDGMVHDPQRIDFMHRYLREYKKAADEGIDLMGYFHWSFLDNFEWTRGYHKRFGLIYVDYENQKRIIKDSAQWYKKVIISNGKNI